jgi:hypothetical protein
LNHAPTTVLPPLGVPCAATSVGAATTDMTSAIVSENCPIWPNLPGLVPTMLTSLPARDETHMSVGVTCRMRAASA